MKKTFELLITEEWGAEYMSHQWGLRNYIACMLGIGFYVVPLAFVALLVLILSGISRPILSIVVVIVPLAALGTIWYWHAAREVRRSWAKWFEHHLGKRVHWMIDEESLQFEGPTGTSRGEWDKLVEIKCFRTVWRLTFVGFVVLLPVRLIDEEIEEFLRKHVHKYGTKVLVQGTFFSKQAALPIVPQRA